MPDQQMLIDYVPGEECRIAVVEDGKLDEYYHERASNESHVSNIYQGVVTNVEPSISAAFVDFGLERNGFLHVTDVHPKYFPGEDKEAVETVGHKTRHGDRPGIERCFKKGDPVTVQVIKEGIGNKGPTVTSYLSIPGRFLVMMPDMQQLGVSRKVEDEDQRKQMKKLLKSLDPPKEFGFIMRTAGAGQTKADLKKDLSYLVRLWKDIEERVDEGDAAGAGRGRKKKGRRRSRVTRELYTESDLVIRTIRDVYTSDIDRVVINHPEAAQRAHDFLAVSNPRAKSKVVFYDDPVPLFHRFGLERQIDNIGSRTVELPSGGALVIDPTEALVAVDVNSGRSRSAKTSESNAFETNKEAVDEVARQLRLRDLGGLVVLDLIDMYQQRHRRAIEARLKKNFQKDKARTRVGGISEFGMLELTRQRMRGSLTESVHQQCAHCGGRGHTKSVESVVLEVMRQLAMVMQQPQVARLELTISPDVAFHMLNRKRAELVALESKWQKAVTVRVGGGSVDYVQVTPLNEQGATLAPTAAAAIPPETDRTFRDVATLEDADLEAWSGSGLVGTRAEPPEVLDGHQEAGGLHDAAEPAEEEEEAPRGRSRGGRGRGEEAEDAPDAPEQTLPEDGEDADRGGRADRSEPGGGGGEGRSRKRRRRGRNRGGDGGGDEDRGDREDREDRGGRGREERGGSDRGGDRGRTERPERAPLPTGPHLDPVLGFEFDPQAHPLDRARAYAEHRLANRLGEGPLPVAGETAKKREAVTQTASVPVGGGEAGAPEAPPAEPARATPAPAEEDAASVAPVGDAEAADRGGPDAEEPADKPKRKRRRRRRGKRSGGGDAEAGDDRPRDEHGDVDGNVREPGPEDPATEEPDDDIGNRKQPEPEARPEAEVVEAKPKRKRKPRVKVEVEVEPEAPAEPEAPEPAEAEAKPKRKPRKKKAAKAEPEAPAEADAVAPEADAPEPAEDAAPPRKKRRSRKKAPAKKADPADGDA